MTPVVAVVPFGAFAHAGTERAGAWARQLARRVVDRFAGAESVDVRPVFLVSMPGTDAQAGYLVFGARPDPALAAEYARSLSATHALTGTYREEGGARRVEAMLVEAEGGGTVAATFVREIAPGELHLAEPALAQWLSAAVGVEVDRDLASPATADEDAYGALLVGMDAEVDSTLLRDSDPHGASSALGRAASAYTVAAARDASSIVIEERILVMAAAAIESDRQGLVLEPLETLAETRPRSWRAQYILGEVRRTSGDASGAIVAFEHSDALHPLRPQDVLTLARLYVTAGAPAVAASRLRRVIASGAEAGLIATARRLLLGIRHPDLERDLEEAGQIAVAGDLARATEAEERFARVLAAEPQIWEAHFGRGLLAWSRGDATEAEAAFSRAIEIEPGAAELVAEMGKPARN
jgi:tetratricopeptide (TPR) repeat protein/TolB-like protein